MTSEQWIALVGASLSLALAVGPWMFKVHAKLAVIASKCADLCEQLETAAVDQRQLWETTHQHRSRLDTHEVQLVHLEQRLRDAQ